LGRLGLIGSVEAVDVRRQIGIARMEQGQPLASVKTGRRRELQHRKAEGGERPRLDQAKAEALHSGKGLGTASQHHDLARLEPAPALATGVVGRGAAGASRRRDARNIGTTRLAAAGVAVALAIATAAIALTVPAAAALAIALAVPVAAPIAPAIPIAGAAPLAAAAVALAISIALAIPVAAAVALAIAVAAAVALAIPVAGAAPLAAAAGISWGNQGLGKTAPKSNPQSDSQIQVECGRMSARFPGLGAQKDAAGRTPQDES
jgi:hypothetical protein